jgi:hypothetical protein
MGANEDFYGPIDRALLALYTNPSADKPVDKRRHPVEAHQGEHQLHALRRHKVK